MSFIHYLFFEISQSWDMNIPADTERQKDLFTQHKRDLCHNVIFMNVFFYKFSSKSFVKDDGYAWYSAIKQLDSLNEYRQKFLFHIWISRNKSTSSLPPKALGKWDRAELAACKAQKLLKYVTNEMLRSPKQRPELAGKGRDIWY